MNKQSAVDESEIKRRKLHKQACADKRDYYLDPETGYMVFTAYYHKERGYCCESGCRHCPYKKKAENQK